MARRGEVDVYFSTDVEADGPVPGPYSMVSIGMAVCGTFDGSQFVAVPVDRHTFYAELTPISEQFDPAALAVSGLSREHLLAEARAPREVMNEAHRWVRAMARELGGRAVFAAYPLSFDWFFVYHYFVQYADEAAEESGPRRSPFGFSSAIDMKTLYAAKSSSPIVSSVKRFMPAHLFGERPHSHNALDDAMEQGELLQNLMAWEGR
jgi:hypothetical protein